MREKIAGLARRWQSAYRSTSIQMILSASFTAVAVLGMVFMGLTLFLRFSATSNAQQSENSQRVLAQVNLNLDSYLRSMMRVSDAAYYHVIKDLDLAEEDPSSELELLYESNRDSLVSIALFSQEGRLLAASPMGVLKTASPRSGRAGSPPPRSGSRTSTSPRPMCRTSSTTRTTATAGWCP